MEGSSASSTEEEYMHLDDADLDADDLAYLELPTDEEVAESTAKQRALMASFKMQRRDEAARRLMAAKRRAAADKLAAVDEARAAAVATAAPRGPCEGCDGMTAAGRACEGGGVCEGARTPIPPALLLRRRPHRRRCPTQLIAAAGSTPPPSPGDRQPWRLRQFRRGRLRHPVVVDSITRILSGVYSASIPVWGYFGSELEYIKYV
jgi:hypothetical protein